MIMVLWIVMGTFLVFRKIKEKTLLKLNNKKLQLIEVKCTKQFEESINEKIFCCIKVLYKLISGMHTSILKEFKC